VTEPRDEIDNWLRHEVEPLPPPPGAFERVHRRARRRKLNQALLASAGAVVVIAGAALVPTLGSGLLTGGSSRPAPAAAASSPRPTVTVTVTPKVASSAPTVSATGSPSVQPPSSTGLSTSMSGAPAPAHFQPSSITMIGSVGAVIGQAGTPGHCGPPKPDDCTSLAGTSNYGQTWHGVSAPVTGVPHDSTGASQLRFLNLQDGWAFGPALWVTSSGGRHWQPEDTFGLRVTGLETAGDRAFAVLASCQSVGASYTAQCSSFNLYSSVAGSTTWQPVSLPNMPPGAMTAAGQASSASLAISGNTGYLLAPSGDIFSGSVAGGAWTYVGRAPCPPGDASYSGAPLGAQLAVDGTRVLLNCATGNGSGALTGVSVQPKRLYQSAGGKGWAKISQPPTAGVAMSLATTSSGHVVLATTAGIDYSPDGTTWRPATFTGGVPPGGFSYVGMTTDTKGVALPADSGLGEVLITNDGGQTWTTFLISG
jgi:hypothetical protein